MAEIYSFTVNGVLRETEEEKPLLRYLRDDLGITLEVLANVTILPGEGIVKTLAAKGGWEFGNVKVAFDCTLTIIASVIAFLAFGRLNGVGIGTLVSALAVGQLVKLYSRCIKRSAARRAGGGAVQ